MAQIDQALGRQAKPTKSRLHVSYKDEQTEAWRRNMKAKHPKLPELVS